MILKTKNTIMNFKREKFQEEKKLLITLFRKEKEN